MIRHTTKFIHCDECPNMLLCGDQGCCCILVEQERREGRLRLNKLHPGERLALMFGGKVTKDTKES